MRHYIILITLINLRNNNIIKLCDNYKICEDKLIQYGKEFLDKYPLYELEKKSKQENTNLFYEYLKTQSEEQFVIT